MNETRTLGPLTLAATFDGPFVHIEVYRAQFLVGGFAITAHEYQSLRATIDRLEELERENGRLRALTMNPGATLHGSTITEIAAERDALKQKVMDLTRELETARVNWEVWQRAARFQGSLTGILEKVYSRAERDLADKVAKLKEELEGLKRKKEEPDG